MSHTVLSKRIGKLGHPGGAPPPPDVRVFLFFLVALLTACSPSLELPAATFAARTDAPAAVEATSTPPAPSSAPDATPTPIPSPTETATPTPTATPPHPLTIAYLRLQDTSQAEITIEEILANGPNYFQYIVSYPSEGLKIRALLTVPFGETPATGWPVIVFNHGYIPPEIYRTTERYIAYVAGFATNGYIVLRPDYRGHDQSEGEARGAYGAPDYTIDVLNAVGAMKKYPDADPNRIGMWGHSMGGYITLRSMVVDPGIKAGVIWAGVVGPYPNIFDRSTFQIDATPSVEGRGRWRLDLLNLFGYPEEYPELWASISANSFLHELSGPVQLHHGTNDDSVPYSVSELLYGQLLEAGQPAEFYGYAGDDHNLSVAFSLVMQRSIQFFDRYVKNLEN
ncbi:MAG TPA: alpha/beta fold hydrolase [Anaerolineales bacterium]|nr:alpha/beta fold hydrolase [Anaerolineales bacterium]